MFGIREHFHFDFDLAGNETRVEWVGAIFNAQGEQLSRGFTHQDRQRVKNDLRHYMRTERANRPGVVRMQGCIKRVITIVSTQWLALEEVSQ